MAEIPAGATLSEDGAWWWDGAQWQAVSGAGGYDYVNVGADGAGGAGGAGNDGGYGSGGYGDFGGDGAEGQGGAPGGYPGEAGGGQAEGGDVEELVHKAIEHGAVHVVDHIVHGVFHIAEGTFELAVMVVEIALGPGDTTVHPVSVRRYVASCDADHGGVSWQAAYRYAENEAADDIARHNYEWPGHAAGATSDEQLVH